MLRRVEYVRLLETKVRNYQPFPGQKIYPLPGVTVGAKLHMLRRVEYVRLLETKVRNYQPFPS